MAVTDLAYKGEPQIYGLTVTIVNVGALNFTDMTTVAVEITDVQGNAVNFTKAAGTVREGDTANEIEIELTIAEINSFVAGVIKGEFTITYANAAFSRSGNVATSISRDLDMFTLYD